MTIYPMLIPPASASTLASSPLEMANRFTSLGQVPRPIPPVTETQYNYYDYIETWLKFPLFQTPNMQHSWFFNFDKKCKHAFPLWFQKWWHFFGPITDLFPDSIQKAIKHFIISIAPQMEGRETTISPLLYFCAKYKTLWICFPLAVPNLKNKEEFPSPVSKQALIIYPTIPGLSDQASVSESKSSSSKQKKTSAKNKNSPYSKDSVSSSKKKSHFDQLKKKDLLQLLKKSIEDNSDNEGSAKESEASSNSDPYIIFDHDSEDYPPRLGDD
ncbi:hypothetical protein CIPAW_11G014100 [Carya illinoinensis]|uniref:Uncharacterized protein n=1 Tax=Carya illinoinensis TaxID=32201 RepID=A0A8T1P285_CARIL|nr:hypothetical protein CIPAW_11G014100 [Carya illinoinensis]